MAFALSDVDFGNGVEGKLDVRQTAGNLFEKVLHLRFFKIHQHAFDHEQHGFAVRGNGVHPRFVEHGRAQIMIVRLGQQHTPHFNHFRQIQIIPGGNARLTQAFVTRIQPRADLHDDGIGMFGDKVPGHIVQQLRPTATADLRCFGFGKLAEVVVNLVQHPHGFVITQKRLRPTLLYGLCPQGNQHSTGQDGNGFGRDFCRHGNLQ